MGMILSTDMSKKAADLKTLKEIIEEKQIKPDRDSLAISIF